MDTSALQAANALADHFAIQDRSRQKEKKGGIKREPAPGDIQERERLMQQLLDASGLSKTALQAQLRIDKATWDRWRYMVTIPHRSHIDSLIRFAKEADQKKALQEDATKPRPLEMLLAGPKTWARLRLVYTYYNWNNAVFSFKAPYNDAETVTEMALLALKGCRIVYFKNEPTEWLDKFKAELVTILGATYAARALSRFCIIPKALTEMPEFGVFNYESPDEQDRVGFQWKGKNPERKADSSEEVYDAVPGNSDLFIDLHSKYGHLIHAAFTEINERLPDDFWSTNLDRQKLLEVPVISLVARQE